MKAAVRNILIIVLAFINTKTDVFAQGGTTYVMSNSPVTVPCDAGVVDPDSLRGNYSAGDRTMVITSSAGNKLGIQIDSFNLRLDGDYINVYDGPTTSSPLLTSLAKSCLPLCPLWDGIPVLNPVVLLSRSFSMSAAPSVHLHGGGG